MSGSNIPNLRIGAEKAHSHSMPNNSIKHTCPPKCTWSNPIMQDSSNSLRTLCPVHQNVSHLLTQPYQVGFCQFPSTWVSNRSDPIKKSWSSVEGYKYSLSLKGRVFSIHSIKHFLVLALTYFSIGAPCRYPQFTEI